MKRRLFFIAVCVFINGLHILAQTKGPGNNSGARQGMTNNAGEGKISGKIVDATSSEPVEYASIAIYRAKDSTLVTGGVTNPAGSFVIESVPFGRFYAKVTFLGYKKKLIDNIMVVPNKNIVSMGTIKLDLNSTALNEVVVTGTTNQVEYRIDKKVVNINQNLSSAGGTIVDALQNTPSIQTDVEGNVTVRGSSNFTVLIDGKPSVVQGSEALQQIPAGLVQNVEIITNPSAKYDAEGGAGIVNVIMKKQKVKGFNGSISLSAGTTSKYNESVNFNYKYDKWNFSLGLDYNDMPFGMTNSGQLTSYNSLGEISLDQKTSGSGKFGRKGKGFKGGIEYSIDNNNTISVSGRVGDRSFNRPMTTYYAETYPLANKSVYLFSQNTGGGKNNFYSLSMDYNLNLNEKGQQLSATVFHSSNDGDSPTLMEQDTTDNLWNKINYSKFDIYEKEKEKEYRFKVDYSYQITKASKLEAGLQSQIENRSSDRSVYLNEVVDQDQANGFTFKHNVSAGYITFSSSLKFFDYQLGLRAEGENRDVSQNKSNQDTVVNRIDLFPSVHLSKQLPWDLQVQASYSRRINRPRDWDLIPFNRFMNTKSIRIGNPAILPEITDAFELNFQKKINEMSYVSLEGFYRKTNNPFQQISSYKDGISYGRSVNYGKDEATGVETMLNLGLTKWWSVTASGSLFNRSLTDTANSVQSNTEWNLRGNTSVRFKTGTSLQINYMYNAPAITGQGTRGASYTTSVAIRQDLFKKKTSLTLQLRDFIGDMRTRMTVNTPTFNSYSLMKRESRVIMLTFTYRINNYKAEKRPAPEMNNDSGVNDMGGGMM